MSLGREVIVIIKFFQSTKLNSLFSYLLFFSSYFGKCNTIKICSSYTSILS
ncbi:MAG: hypothetical protein LBQ24_00245 [Candidatus Peribacteria bacterium]|nr:hypothetical protein [Candidatus Peribacteria bacterium]